MRDRRFTDEEGTADEESGANGSLPASPRAGRESPSLTLKIKPLSEPPASGGLRMRLGKQVVAAKASKRKRSVGGSASPAAGSPAGSPGPIKITFKGISPAPE